MGTFMTERKYKRMLREIGYKEDSVEVRGISKDCFAPLARFLEEREQDLKGIGLGLGSFMAAKWIFRW